MFEVTEIFQKIFQKMQRYTLSNDWNESITKYLLHLSPLRPNFGFLGMIWQLLAKQNMPMFIPKQFVTSFYILCKL